MRIFAATVVLAAASLLTVACGSSSTNNGTGVGGGALNGNGTAAATCDGACEHYLTCKGVDSPANRQTCVGECGKMNLTQDQLSSFVQSDCQAAVAAVDGNGTMAGAGASGGSTGGTGGTGGGSTSAPDCRGCTWDGSSCIYLTGSGGNYFNCDAKCC